MCQLKLIHTLLDYLASALKSQLIAVYVYTLHCCFKPAASMAVNEGTDLRLNTCLFFTGFETSVLHVIMSFGEE